MVLEETTSLVLCDCRCLGCVIVNLLVYDSVFLWDIFSAYTDSILITFL